MSHRAVRPASSVRWSVNYAQTLDGHKASFRQPGVTTPLTRRCLRPAAVSPSSPRWGRAGGRGSPVASVAGTLPAPARGHARRLRPDEPADRSKRRQRPVGWRHAGRGQPVRSDTTKLPWRGQRRFAPPAITSARKTRRRGTVTCQAEQQRSATYRRLRGNLASPRAANTPPATSSSPSTHTTCGNPAPASAALAPPFPLRSAANRPPTALSHCRPRQQCRDNQSPARRPPGHSPASAPPGDGSAPLRRTTANPRPLTVTCPPASNVRAIAADARHLPGRRQQLPGRSRLRRRQPSSPAASPPATSVLAVDTTADPFARQPAYLPALAGHTSARKSPPTATVILPGRLSNTGDITGFSAGSGLAGRRHELRVLALRSRRPRIVARR